MASAPAMSFLSQEEATELAFKSSAGKVLSGLHLPLPDQPNAEEPFGLAVVYLLHVRTGGFMIIAPHSQLLQEFLQGLVGDESVPVPYFHPCEVEVETNRGRRLGTIPAMLVDLSWEFLASFKVAVVLRGAARNTRLLQLEVDETACRPVKDSAFAAADQWISSGGLEEEIMEEYITGQEYQDLEAEPELMVDPSVPVGTSPPPQVVAQLQQRIQELEAQLSQRQQPTAPAQPSIVAAHPKTPPLFGIPERSRLTPPELQRLQALAGTPPPRVSSAEKRRPVPSAKVAFQDQTYVDIEREAEDPSEGLAQLGYLEVQGNVTMEQMMLSQLKQNQVLLQKLVAPRHSDPVLGALSSGGSDSAGGSASGVKGCLARKAYVKISQDLPRLASVVRANALRELGIHPSKEDGSLMKKYLERRMALGEHRLLAHFGCMLAETWTHAFETQNIDMMGALARMFLFVEQAGLDSGRLQMAWLLTGFQEPAIHLMPTAKKLPGLAPFSRLSAPTWISANVAYLKDLDYFEARMQTVGPTKTAVEEVAPTPKPKPKPKQRPPKGAGRKGNDGGTEESAS